MNSTAPIDEVRNLFNHICILYDTDLVRVIGFHEDAMDVYYTVRDKFGKEYHASFVGGCISLKGIYPRYQEMDRLFHQNQCPREEHFRYTIASALENFKMYGVLE